MRNYSIFVHKKTEELCEKKKKRKRRLIGKLYFREKFRELEWAGIVALSVGMCLLLLWVARVQSEQV